GRRARRLSLLPARDGQRRDGGSRLAARGGGHRHGRRPRRARLRLGVARGRARAAARGPALPRRPLAVSRLPWELRALLALVVLDGAAVVATYARFPASELYHVHHSGIAAGFGRELVALNFPFALVGIALVGLAWPRLGGRLRLAGAAAIALCAVVYFAVDQTNLDAKWLNALPALGLALAVALVLAAGVPSVPRSTRGDPVRLGLAALLVLFC